MNRRLFSFILLAVTAAQASTAWALQPKYGPEATPLSRAPGYFRSAKAPDFWALIPYYLPQQDGRSCSLASVTMLLNAVRSRQDLTSDDELATQPTLLAKVNHPVWNKALGPLGRGVTLDQLGTLIEATLKAYGLQKAQIQVVHTDSTDPAALQDLRKALEANEKNPDDFLVANFSQGTYTGDTGGGHIAPIAAYDPKTRKVLVLDPDRQWYEPYWVSDQTFLKGMATKDPDSAKNRGYVRVQLGARGGT